MDVQLIIAAGSGSITSALRYIKQSKLRAFRTFLTGFLLAYFAAIDLTNSVNHYFNIELGYEGVFFVLGYLGSEILERAITLINAYTVKSKWN